MIEIDGPIGSGDASKFIEVASSISKSAITIYLNSPGGNVREAMVISQYVRYSGYSAFAGPSCLSACFPIFSSAGKRFFTDKSKIGVHGAFDAVTNAEAGEVTISIIHDLKTWGIPDIIIGHMASTSPSDIYYLSNVEMKQIATELAFDPIASAQALTVSPPIAVLPTTGKELPTASKASLLEEAANKKLSPKQSVGQVMWQIVKTPSGEAEKPDVVRLQGRVEIPGRDIVLIVTMELNSDAGLQATHLIKLEFKLPSDFNNKSVARVPGMIMKASEDARGDPLAGATAKITSNLFWIALYAADADRENNLRLLKTRDWIDIPIVYENNRRAMLTLQKADTGDKVFSDALAAWQASTQR